MPTYDFTCKTCGHQFEHRQSMSAPPETECPECGKVASREFTPNVNFQFKGEGFYITDYRSDQYKKDAAKDKAPAPAPKSGGEASTGTSSSAPAPKKSSDS